MKADRDGYYLVHDKETNQCDIAAYAQQQDQWMFTGDTHAWPGDDKRWEVLKYICDKNCTEIRPKHFGLSVYEYKRERYQPLRTNWNRPAVEPGTTCYAISYGQDLGYFTYSYLSAKQAEDVMHNLKGGENTKKHREFNVKYNVNETIVVKERS